MTYANPELQTPRMTTPSALQDYEACIAFALRVLRWVIVVSAIAGIAITINSPTAPSAEQTPIQQDQ